jgi:DNA-binding HxlR family transcriptional regulator
VGQNREAMKKNLEVKKTLIFRDKEYKCGIDVTLAVIGGKWKSAILYHLAQQTMRFSELQRQFTATSRKMLTQQLRELEQDDLVHREVYPQVPPKVEYSLTDKGRSIKPILDLMCDWGAGYAEG